MYVLEKMSCSSPDVLFPAEFYESIKFTRSSEKQTHIYWLKNELHLRPQINDMAVVETEQ